MALLGRGGMGEVYRADDLTLDQAVALKFRPDGVTIDAARLAQFHNELRVARQVSHKNVCRLYDLGEFEGRRFLTMEYVDGEDLASLLRRIGRIPQDKALQIARQLCAGLAAAHERGVVHRDLKPANVMIDGDGNARITDFGLAVPTGDKTAGLAGTPQYMAPEQLNGQPATIKSDLYALGLVLFEIFTGRRAHEAKTLDELRRVHENGGVVTPSSVLPDINPAVERVVMRCLDRDPALRPSSAQFAFGAGEAIADVLRMVYNALQNTMIVTLVFVLTRTVVHRAWLAGVITTAVIALFFAGEQTGAPLLANLALSSAAAGVGVFALVRAGVLAATTASFVNILLPRAPIVLEPSRIYPSTGIWLVIFIVCLALAAFYASRGDEPLFKATTT